MAKHRQILTPPAAVIADDRASRFYVPMRLRPVMLQSDLAEGERREYGVQFVKAGRVMARDGSEANWEIPAATLRAAVSLLAARPVFIDHADGGWFGPDTPSIRDAAAVTFEPVWNNANQSIDGGIRLYNRPDLEWLRIMFDEILADQEAGREDPGFGGSMTFFGRHDWVDVGETPGEEFMRVTTEITYVESWDIVFSPGADGRIKEILSSVGYSFPASLGTGPNNKNGGVTMKYCSHCGSELVAGKCPNGHDLTQQTQLATAQAGGGQQQAPAGNGQSQNNGQQQQNSGQQQQNNGQSAQNGGQAQASGQQQQNGNQGQQAPPPPDPGQALQALGRNMEQLQQILVDDSVRAQASIAQDLAERFDKLVQQVGERSRENAVFNMGNAPNDRRLPRIVTGKDELERFQGNINWLFGVDKAEVPDPEFRRADLMYVALTGDYEFQGVFKPEKVKLSAANPTTLANMAVDAMNKVINAQFSSLRYWRWYEAVAAVAPNDGSLQSVKWITFGGVGNLPVIQSGGPYTELDVDDVKESSAFTKHGAFIGITREMIKNSDIGRIQAIPRALAAASVRTRSAAISSIFTDNSGVGPTLAQDSTALFHSDHSNVQTTAFGTDTTAWAAASLECFNHTEVNSGKKLGVFPRYALVPADLYVTAKSVFGYGEGMPTSYQPFSVDNGLEDPRPIPLVVPDWTDATDWAYLVDPQVYPVIQMSYSQAPGGGMHPAPELFLVMSETAGLIFTNDTLPIKVRDEFAFGVNGPRGIGKRNVAG